MSQDYAADIGATQIAERLGYSPEHLSRRCLKSTGYSLHQLLLRIRVEQSKELLRLGAVPIKEAAFAAGFKSVHHFSRVFKALVGEPPARWRDREIEGIWQDVKFSRPSSTRIGRSPKCSRWTKDSPDLTLNVGTEPTFDRFQVPLTARHVLRCLAEETGQDYPTAGTPGGRDFRSPVTLPLPAGGKGAFLCGISAFPTGCANPYTVSEGEKRRSYR